MNEKLRPSEVFAKRLKAMRKLRGLTQTELAEQMTAAGRELDRAAILRIEKGTSSQVGGRGLSLDEALALMWVLPAVPAQMLTPPEGDWLAVTEAAPGVDGEGLRNWFAFGDPLLAMPAAVDSDETRAVLRERLERVVLAHALALADASRSNDTAGIKAAGAAIVDAVRDYDELTRRSGDAS